MLVIALSACTRTSGPATADPNGELSFGTTTPLPVVDSFTVDTPTEVDVLVVVDPALLDARRHILGDALSPLLSYATMGLAPSWHVGFVSAALGGPNPGAVTWVDASESDSIETLLGAELDDQVPSGALGASWLALQDGANPGFRRPGADLIVFAAQAADDATPTSIVDEATWRTWFAGLDPAASFDAAVPVGAAPVLEGIAADFGAGASHVAAGLYEPLDRIGRAERAPVFPLSVIPSLFVGARVSGPDPDNDPEYAFDASEMSWDPVENTAQFVQYIPYSGWTVEITYYP